jgi:hypothetical protein
LAGTEIRRFSDDRASFLGNWPAALIHAVALSLADAFIFPTVIMAGYITLHSTSLYAVALVPTISVGLWNLGAMTGKYVTFARRRQLPWAFGASAVRAAAMALLAYSAHRDNIADSDRIRSFFVALTVFAFASGFAVAPTRELLQKSTEGSSRHLLFVRRAFWGTLVSIMGGLIIWRVFGPDGPETNRAFAYLFLAAAACLASASFFLLLIKEPVRIVNPPRVREKASPNSILRNRALRRYLVFRMAAAAVAGIDVFLVVYAIRELSMPLKYLGVFSGFACAALFLTLPLFRSLAGARGGKSTLQLAVWAKLVAPMVALMIPYLRESAEFRERVSGEEIYYWLLAVAFAAIGVNIAGQITGNFQYLLEIAPPSSRDGYLATTNRLLAIACVAPLISAFIADRWDFDTLFAVASGIGLLSVLMTGMLVDTRMVAARPAPALGMRRLSPR